MIGGRAQENRAVDGVDVTVRRGRVTVVVGESGAGKSTVGRMLVRLIEPDSGSIRFDGQELVGRSAKQMRALRRRMQVVFQDPFSSLDPRMTVAESVGEPLLVHTDDNAETRRAAAEASLERVGLSTRFLDRYPGELSGGQLQRVAIARALIVRPDFIFCDEPTAALDVSVQAQVLNLLTELQQEFGLSLLFVTHDLALVQVVADDVVVMRQGRVVEQGTVGAVLHAPQEDYTRELLAAVPRPVPRRTA